MAKRCDKCEKRPSVGHTVSHSNIKTLRRYEPNIIRKRMIDVETGKMMWIKLCTACLRTMVKAPRVKNPKKRGPAPKKYVRPAKAAA